MTTDALSLWQPGVRHDARAVVERFATMDCPGIAEMDGEYAARALPQPNPVFDWFAQRAISNPVFPGIWLSKAFTPLSEREGRGYNSFRLRGHVLRRYPMQTVIAPSRFDGKPAYQLIYSAYDSLFGWVNMVDEVRRAAEGHYLGIGTLGFTERQRLIPLPFTLRGPTAAFNHQQPRHWTRRDARSVA